MWLKFLLYLLNLDNIKLRIRKTILTDKFSQKIITSIKKHSTIIEPQLKITKPSLTTDEISQKLSVAKIWKSSYQKK